MATSGSLPVGYIIFQSLRIPFVGFRRLLWDAGFFLSVNYVLAIGLLLSGTIRFEGRGWPLLVVLVVVVAYGLVATYFMVGWHRTVMSDGTASRQPFLPRFEKAHFFYLLWGLGVVALVIFALLVLSLVMSGILSGLRFDPGWWMSHRVALWFISSMVRFVLNAILVAALGRFLLAFPIIATGGGAPFRTADALYDGRWLPVTLVLVGIVTIGTVLEIAMGLIALLISGSGTLFAFFSTLEFLLGPLFVVVVGAVFLNALTLTYRHLLALNVAGSATGPTSPQD